MFELFSDIFTCRDNALRRIDPRPKLVAAFAAIVTVILSTHVALPLAVFAACLLTLAILRMPMKLVLLRLAAPLGVALMVLALQTLLIGETPLARWPVAGAHLTLFREGLDRGVLIASRVLGAVSVMLLLSFVTPAHQIFNSLRWFRVPTGWVEIAMLMYRYVFALIELTDDMVEAQRLRLGYDGARRSLSSLGTLAGAVTLRSLEQAIHTHEAMMVRGYRGSIPFGPLPHLATRDRWIMALAPLIALCLGLAWGGWR
jgi:cobalt/nickel transport system permease protein